MLSFLGGLAIGLIVGFVLSRMFDNKLDKLQADVIALKDAFLNSKK